MISQHGMADGEDLSIVIIALQWLCFELLKSCTCRCGSGARFTLVSTNILGVVYFAVFVPGITALGFNDW
jgi:hypothetical protein